MMEAERGKDMTVSTTIEQTWNDLAQIYQDGWITNQSMFAFVLLKALSARLTDLQVAYDARSLPDEKFRPDLVIWKQGDRTRVLFVGQLKFKSKSDPIFEHDMSKLQEIIKKPAMDVLDRNPVTGHYFERQIRLSSDYSFGIFAIGESDRSVIDRCSVTESLSSGAQSRFHFAYGSIPNSEDREIEFKYIKPSSTA
jgi:hypothetical protein